MRTQHELTRRRRAHWKPAVGALTFAALAFGATACADSESTTDTDGAKTEDTATPEGASLLGEANPATGETVKIGFIGDGRTEAFDNSAEFDGAKATAAYWNEYQGGIAGHKVEVVTCETGADVARAVDCANKMISDDVVGVALAQSAVAADAWRPINQAGIPFMLLAANGTDLLADTTATYNLNDGNATLFALPISLAAEEDISKVAFVVIDVPQALTGFEGDNPAATDALSAAGIGYDLIKVPVGTADMTQQMQSISNSDAGLVYVVGNDAFCIAAFNGLEATGFTGSIAATSHCVTDATRDAVSADVLDGMHITALVAEGGNDESVQLYEEIMATFAPNAEDDDPYPMSAYAVTGALLTSLKQLTGDVTAESVNSTIKAMELSVIPGTAGMEFQCNGQMSSNNPSVCTNQVLSAVLNAEGYPASYQVSDLPT